MKTAVMCLPGCWIVYDSEIDPNAITYKIFCMCGTEHDAVLISDLLNQEMELRARTADALAHPPT